MEIDDYIIASDAELAERARSGDHRAFECLFNRYADSLRRMFVQRGHTAEADDLLQETFIKVYFNLERYDAAYTFGQWIYTIARNTSIDSFRRRQPGDIPIDERLSAPASSAPTPEESVINAQQRSDIESFLEHLSDNYRRMIEMRFFDEYSYEEIAEKLSLPLGTVKTQIHRARERMCRLIIENDK